MSVLLVTDLGDIVIDLYHEECPRAATNFLKLCKMKYYNNVLFYNVQANFMVQTGDPTGTGRGGSSVFGLLYGEQARFFEDEIRPELRHNRVGVVSMANGGRADENGSQFFITTRGEDLAHLDGRHTVFGQVAEGLDVLAAIDAQFVDEGGRPLRDVRIRHTLVLDDPLPDPRQLEAPDASPVAERPAEERVEQRIGATEELDEHAGKSREEVEEALRDRQARKNAVMLEMAGDLPDADVKPPEEVLFVCKLNPVTTDDDLHSIFVRFGAIRKCEVIRDFKTGDSLRYAFVEFREKGHAEEAFRKMDNVLIDDCRIKVDFSQSVSKLWNSYRRGGSSSGGGPPRGAGAGGGRAPDAVTGSLEFRGRGRGGGGGGGGGYGMVFDDGDEAAGGRRRSPPRRRQSRSRSRSRSRDRRRDDRRRDDRRGDRRDDRRDDRRGRDRRDERRSRDDRRSRGDRRSRDDRRHDKDRRR